MNESIDFSKNLSKNIELIKTNFHQSPELSVRTIELVSKRKCSLVYLDGIVNTELIREGIMDPLFSIRVIDEDFINTLMSRYIRSESVHEVISLSDSIDGVARGKTLVLVDGFERGLLVNTAEWEKRQIEQSTRQRNVQGPLIAFSEQLSANLNVIHNFIQSPNLMVEKRQMGTSSKTDVAIVYLTDRVDQKVLTKTLDQIDTLQVDYALESRIIDKTLENKQKTIFPLIFTTELPDATVSALYEGKIAILMNGTPSASIVPCLFVQFFQQPGDYYVKPGNSMRFLTWISFFLTTLLPGSYVALVKFHSHWVPKKFVKEFFTHKHTLFPVWFEVFLIIFLLQLLSYGSFKISKDSIIVVSLISTVTIGSTAVDAKLIHPLSLVVVGVTFLANTLLTVGTFSLTLYHLRYAFLLIGSLFGFTGMIVGFVLMIIHLALLRSVGVPYLAPIIPFNAKEMKDVFFRGNLHQLINSKHTYPHDQKEQPK